jgi:hypothetical protein
MNPDDLKRLIEPCSEYEGPQEFSHFGDFLPFIGEVVLGFARMERWLTWSIESAMQIHPQQADAIQESIMSVSARINLFHTLCKPHALSAEMDGELERIVKKLRELNDYRNLILHGPWFGTSEKYGADGRLVERGAMKAKYAQLGSKTLKATPRLHTKEEMRAAATAMIQVGRELYSWICETFPTCEKRVP